MGIYNFESRFVPFILEGTKTHTIRALCANPDKAGNLLHLYTGLRRKGSRLLMRARCTRVEYIRITQDRQAKYGYAVMIDGQQLSPDEMSDFVNTEGFACFADFIRYWREKLPFDGEVIHWETLRKEQRFLPKAVVNKNFRLWAQLLHGYVEIMCDRCGHKVATLEGIECRKLVEILRDHHCNRAGLANAWRPIKRRSKKVSEL